MPALRRLPPFDVVYREHSRTAQDQPDPYSIHIIMGKAMIEKIQSSAKVYESTEVARLRRNSAHRAIAGPQTTTAKTPTKA